MSFLLAISPGLIWFGPLLLVLGGLGLALSPVGRSEIRRVLVTGFDVTLVGTMTQLLVGPMAGAAMRGGVARRGWAASLNSTATVVPGRAAPATRAAQQVPTHVQTACWC